MRMSRQTVLIAVCLAAILGALYEYHARYAAWERISAYQASLDATLKVGMPRADVEAGLRKNNLPFVYSADRGSMADTIVVGRFMVFYETQWSFVVLLDANERVAGWETHVFNEGL